MHNPGPNQTGTPLSTETPHHNEASRPQVQQSQELAVVNLSQGDLPTRSSSLSSVQATLGDVLSLLSAGTLRGEVLERREELRKPLDPELDVKAASAVETFRQIDVTRQNDIFTSFFKSTNLDRASWTMPTCPVFLTPGSAMEKEAHAFNVKMGQSLLTTGLLPREEAVRSAQTLGAAIPDYRGRGTFVVASIVSAGVIASSFFVAPWVTAVTAIGGLVFCRGFAHRPSLHLEYAAGYVMETLDAFKTLESGSNASLKSTMDYYFNDPEFRDAYKNYARADAFLLARTFRLLGHSNEDVLQAFQDPRTVDRQNNELAPKVVDALQEHDVTLQGPLVGAFMDSGSPEHAQLVAFLETMNVAHFTWGARDKDNLRLELAQHILRNA